MCAQRDRKPGFDSEFDGVTLKIRLRGEIDHHTAAVVRVSMDELIRSRAPRVLALDMSAVDFMDSSGLGLMMGRYSLMQALGGETVVLDPSPATEKIMGLAGMERMIKIKRTKIATSDMGDLRDTRRRAPTRGRVRRKMAERGVGVAAGAVCSSCGQEIDKRGEAK
jgi:stage II sporulation protein AA (anti-sigma F factor antagonist)